MRRTTTDHIGTDALHTPGPWESNYGGMVHANNGETAIARCLKDAQGYRLGIPRTQQTANARLIAAAPDLLTALQGIRSGIQFAGGIERRQSIDNAVAAIAKAEGRSSLPKAIEGRQPQPDQQTLEVLTDSGDLFDCPLGKRQPRAGGREHFWPPSDAFRPGMRASITVRMESAAFRQAPGTELCRLLRNLARRIEAEAPFAAVMRDSKGSTVGIFCIEPDWRP